jgi:hypothetical protein
MAADKHEAQLVWERRAAVPVAVAAILAGLLMIQTLFVRGALYDDRKGVESTPDYLLSLHAHSGAFLASAIAEALGVLALGVVLFFLFRAIRYRTPEVPEAFKWLAIVGPVLLAAATVYGFVETSHAADKFAAGLPIRGDAGKDRAEDLLKDVSPVTIALQLAGQLSVAFAYVMLSVRAMRAGLLSRFMGILGVIVGVLLVIRILPQPLLQLFWLGAFAALVLGYWPNGRGPAWETGEAAPWPPPARRAGLQGEGPGSVEPEAIPERPASRKRKRAQD